MRLTARRLGLVALAVAAVIAFTWWCMPQGTAVERNAGSGAALGLIANEMEASFVRGETQDSPHDAAAAALPPRNTPIEGLWSALQDRAQAGDSRAACRLAIETIRCATAIQVSAAVLQPSSAVRGELQALIDFERSPTSFAQTDEAEDAQAPVALEGFSSQVEAAAARCEGMSSERASSALTFLRASALAGQADAQTVYAAGEGWFLALPDAMASPEFDQWRREAPLVVARMLDAGHPDAPGLLAGAYSDQTWLAGLYDYDIERAAAFLMLNTRLMDKPGIAEQQLRNISPAARARAREQSDALYSKHYQGRTNAKAEFFLAAGTRLAQPDFFGEVFEGGKAAIPCESPAR